MGVTSVAVKVGDTLEGRYRIIKSVGAGGMGTVYLAEHMLIRRRVAIKILRTELATDSDVVDRFMQEARAAGAIGHPHIVESTDMGFTRDGVPFIVFEYLEGSLLTDEIYRVRGIPPRRALRIATQIASALHAAHSAGIVHRDLKSDNIFLTDKGDASDHVKVLDFGISRFLEADASDDESRHLIMGTPEFMAPEQILTPERVDRRADIYALGVVLYEMLTARRPFDFDEPDRTDERRMEETDKLLHRIVTEPVPTTGRKDLPPGLEELIREKLMAKDPDERFQSMRDVQAAFEAFFDVTRRDSDPMPLSGMTPTPAGEQISVSPPPMPAPRADARQRHGPPWLAAALVAGGAGGALMLVDGNENRAAATGSSAAKRALEEAAAKLGATLDSQAQATRMRAEGIASLPMLRAAIETDAATLRDMVRDRDVLFKAQADEVLEIFQRREGATSTMLRIPENAPALAAVADDETILHGDGTRLHLVVGSQVANQKGRGQGVVVLSRPVDLAPLKQAIATHARQAALVGIDKPIVLAGAGVPATPVTIPIATSPHTKLSGLAIAATLDAPAADATANRTFRFASYAAWALAGLLLVAFGITRTRKS